MTLFDDRRKAILNRQAPLATRMRPRTLDEFVGQEKLVGAGRVVRRMIEARSLAFDDSVGSAWQWQDDSGAADFGELRRVILRNCQQLRPACAIFAAKPQTRSTGSVQRVLGRYFLIDEIHRFSKSQQDALLPHVEAGTFILIGATTENPSFEVIAPLLSRTRVYTMESIDDDGMNRIIDSALTDLERGLGAANPMLDNEARSFLLSASNGDARSALNALEIAVESAPEEDGRRIVHCRLG